MDGSLEKALSAEAAKLLANAILQSGKAAIDYLFSPSTEPDRLAQLSRHLVRVHNWASTYNFLGLGLPKSSSSDTIQLRFHATPRRYRALGSQDQSSSNEEEFLTTQHSVLLLGDPGAGKTTTLKRLALSLLGDGPRSPFDIFQFPLLLVLRDLPRRKFVCEEIADIFDIVYEKTLRPEVVSRDESLLHLRSDYEIRVEGRTIEDVLSDILNATKPLILVDGLDELDPSQRHSVEREIEALDSRLTNSRIILSCRSGDYSTNFHGFRLTEIAPLNDAEIKNIAELWLGDSTEFIAALKRTPYSDIVDRPLLLSFILYLFISEGELPNQPAQIYRKVVYRLLNEWDEERRIKRASKYAHFDSDRKIDFLSELAYHLTYELKAKSFSGEIFRQAYKDIHSSFNLPSREYVQVAQEIETHTGIVVVTGIDRFEFSHLSIQEYLAANYICRSPHPDLLKQYLSQYPAPVAVACALSSNPSVFFSEMINRHLGDKFRNPHDALRTETVENQLSFDLFGQGTANNLRSFVSRLQIENPYFKVDQRFGDSLLCVFAFYYRRYSQDLDSTLTSLLRLPGVSKSIEIALDHRRAKDDSVLPYRITEKTILLDIDAWFKSVYEAVSGPWPSNEQQMKVLPFVAFPADVFEGLWHGSYHPISRAPNREPPHKDRIGRTLAYTPFCEIDQGRHKFNTKHVCQVCFRFQPPAHVPRRRPAPKPKSNSE
ncbi:MAG: NACHT domain-containing NTPase [Reyranellaceae bacterium]